MVCLGNMCMDTVHKGDNDDDDDDVDDDNNYNNQSVTTVVSFKTKTPGTQKRNTVMHNIWQK
jgi:hypothetical protein